MTKTVHKPAQQRIRSSVATLTLIACCAGGLAWPSLAQSVYRIVDANGKVTFSDKPPAKGAASPVTAGAGAEPPAAALPYVLRQAMAKNPVVLYTGPDCNPCSSGRTLLQQRGIPFTERTSSNIDDAAVLRRMFGDNALPV